MKPKKRSKSSAQRRSSGRAQASPPGQGADDAEHTAETDAAEPAGPFDATLAALAQAWRIVAAATLTFYVATWLITSTGVAGQFKIAMPDTRREHLPIFLLSLGCLAHAASLYFLARYARLRRQSGEPRNARIPWATDSAPGTDPTGVELRRLWLVVALLFAVVGPLVLDADSWRRFRKGDAWHNKTMTPVSLFEPVSPSLFFGGWDDYRYGNFGKAQKAPCPDDAKAACGVSFVPLWQPLLLMAVPTMLALALAGWACVEIARREEP